MVFGAFTLNLFGISLTNYVVYVNPKGHYVFFIGRRPVPSLKTDESQPDRREIIP